MRHTTRRGYDDVAAQTLSGELSAAKSRARSTGEARRDSQARQFCGACEAGVEHTHEEEN